MGISGATGAIYGIRLLEILRNIDEVETHLIITAAGRRTIAFETNTPPQQVEMLADVVHKAADIGAAISSGSFRTHGMIVAPCSMKTVSGIATSYSDNLLLRAADVTLKDRRRLLLLVRETPLHRGHLGLLAQVTDLGAIVMPPVPAFYHRPSTMTDLIDQTVNRALDLMEIELPADLVPRWSGMAAHGAQENGGAGHNGHHRAAAT